VLVQGRGACFSRGADTPVRPMSDPGHSMKICYFDAFSGIGGDMTVGALVGADAITAALDSLGAGAVFRPEKVKRKGVTASKFTVEAEDTKKHRHLPRILKRIEGGGMSASAKQNATDVFQRLGEAEAAVHGVPVEKVHAAECGTEDCC
jgi:pyridinium-3,5-bisthiocarboxylic acid mononucleotide nickel chelatase